jgi:cytochrome c oxidase subunit I
MLGGSMTLEPNAPPTAASHPTASTFRKWFGWTVLTALVFSIIGWFVGAFVGHELNAANHFNGLSGSNDVAVICGYVGATIGWIGGLGFFNYPIRRMLGFQAEFPAEAATGTRRYFVATSDHKVVGNQYLLAISAFFLIGGVNAMLIRAELLRPAPPIYNAGAYIALVGEHGTLMMMMITSAITGPFANYFVPLMIGSRRMAFPRLEAFTFWLVPLSGVILLSALFYGGFPTGWTGYAPLNGQAGAGMDGYVIGFTLGAASMMLGGFNLLATIFTMRAPGMTWGRLPIFVWGVVTTAVLQMLASPVLIAALMMAAIDRGIDTSFFVTATGGSPFLFDNLFWVFGHPEVYIVALPGFAIVMELLPVFSRKPLWGYRLAVGGLMGVTFLSFTVWQHHLFVSGINADLRPFYMLSTELISVPTGVIFLIAMGTLWRSRIEFTVPMLFCLGWVFNFLIGGISGVYLSDVPSDVTAHGSFVVMAHFHYTIMGGLVFAFFAAIYYWVPKMTGMNLNQTLGKWQFWTTFLSFNSTFLPLFALGMLGMPRRVVVYPSHLQLLNDWVSISAFVLGLSLVLLLVNVVWSLMFKQERAEANPWRSLSLEWQLPTPVPRYNFDTIPTINNWCYDYGKDQPVPVADLTAPGTVEAAPAT